MYTAHQVEDPDIGVRMQGVAEDEDERHSAVSESAVDESGLAASPLRVPLADEVDARRVDQACADAAAYGEAEVGDHQVVAVGDADEADRRQDRACQHGGPGRDDALLAELSSGKGDACLEEGPDGKQPERLGHAPAVRLPQGLLGGAVAVFVNTDRHHGGPRQPDHPGPGPAEEFAVGLPDAVDAVVRVGDLAITCGSCRHP